MKKKKAEQKKLLKGTVNSLIEETINSIEAAESFNGIKVKSGTINTDIPEVFKEFGEELKKKLKKCVCLFGSVIDNKINLVCIISDDIKDYGELHAGKLISKYAKMLGGGGGGRPNIATAGGKDINKLDEVLKLFERDAREIINK